MDEMFQRVLEGEVVFNNPGCTKPKSLSSFKNSKLAIYGVGECSHWLYEIAMKRIGLRPVVALDKNRTIDHWCGLNVCTAEEYQTSSIFEHEKIEIIVCVGSRETFHQIQKNLSNIGFYNIHYLHDFYEIHSFFVWESKDVDTRISANKENFNLAFSLLSDDLSREIFCRITQVHITRNPIDIPSSPRNEQYFPRDLPLSKGHHTYVCCGAYDGENIRLLRQNLGMTNTIICFEPEPLIYAKLTDCAKEQSGFAARNIICFHDAVSDENGIFPFVSGDGLGSRLDRSGESYARCVRLDDALASFRPSFISMDIEGAESLALEGARSIITEYKPDLGICAYHFPEQIASVILKIQEIQPGYKFYIRNYTSYLTETVVYACHKN